LEAKVNKLKWIFIGLLLAGLLAIPQLPSTSNKTLTLLIQIFIMAALASSWNILGGYAGQVNLGHAAFFGLGSLTTRLLWLNDYPLALSLIAGGIVATIFALLIGAPALRLRGIYFAIGTLALAQALHITVGNILPGNSALPGPKIAGYDLAPRSYLLLGLLIVIVAISYWLTRAKLGLGMMTVRAEERAAPAIGIDAFRNKLTAFVMSAFRAGWTCSAFAYFHVSYYYQFTFTPVWTFDAVLVTFIGGIGTVVGPLVGAFFFVLIRDVLATNITNFHLIIFGVLFILVVLILPGGLLELWERIIGFGKRMSPQPIPETAKELKGEKEMT
jgi:branched-chain amino acid transport system permease protein